MNVWPIVDLVVRGILVGPFSEEWYRWREATSLREFEKAQQFLWLPFRF